MKIALLGYGKMGKVIERIALERGHEVVLRKGSADDFAGLENADVAIDFSIPDAAVGNITACLSGGTPIVSGTTGWLEHYPKMAGLCQQNQGAFIYGSNFSLGVNLFFQLNEYLSRMMANFTQYQARIEEVHHTQKLDAPSGTAISLAKDIIESSDYSSWALFDATRGEAKTDNVRADEILIVAKREENVPGTHTVTYTSGIDSIEIRHTAHSREGFALGAVIAAEWLLGRTGVFTMKDVLGLNV